MLKSIHEIRIYPLDRFAYPTIEYAKLCIGNGYDSYSSLSNLYSLNGGIIDLFHKTLFLFQYEGKIIAKGIVQIEEHFLGSVYYVDDIEVLDEEITADEIKAIYQEFKKFISAAQRIPLGYLPEILKLFEEKKKEENIKLCENESFYCNPSKGNRIEYYVTKYERNSKYREQAIEIHGLTCQICGFNFEIHYGKLGEGYIEVHHRKPLYTLKEEIVPNPETDLICVCANCHKMLHRHKNSIIAPEELIRILRNQNEE